MQQTCGALLCVGTGEGTWKEREEEEKRETMQEGGRHAGGEGRRASSCVATALSSRKSVCPLCVLCVCAHVLALYVNSYWR